MFIRHVWLTFLSDRAQSILTADSKAIQAFIYFLRLAINLSVRERERENERE